MKVQPGVASFQTGIINYMYGHMEQSEWTRLVTGSQGDQNNLQIKSDHQVNPVRFFLQTTMALLRAPVTQVPLIKGLYES
jgi:hypothetical protein